MSVLSYQRETLRGLLCRSVLTDDALDRLDELWDAMSPAEQQAADLWVRGLPEPLRRNGPEVMDDWDRASGSAECSVCGLTYLDHPCDPRETLQVHVTCDGRRWKL
jgi:hypothetical protein